MNATLLVAMLGVGMTGGAQDAPLVVSVVSELSRMPVSGATVTSLALGRTARTDRLGRARFSSVPRPSRLVVAAIGYEPDTVEVRGGSLEIEVTLRPLSIQLGELLSAAPTQPAILTPSLTGRWSVPRVVLQEAPAAVEVDPIRALNVVPSVSFSTPLSARPSIRGYDASEGVIQVDGFEVFNPYHIGRAFSSVPAYAVESVDVVPVPFSPRHRGALSGVVQIEGRSAGVDTTIGGGAELSIVSAGGWVGNRKPFPVFLAARYAFLQFATDLVSEGGVPYDFRDVYGRTRLPLGGRRAWDVTLYASSDDFNERSQRGRMDWLNLLIGNRWRVVDDARARVDVIASGNRFEFNAADIEARNSRIDIRNRFDRLSGGLIVEVGGSTATVTLGGDIAHREVRNVLRSLEGDDFEPIGRTSQLDELGAFAEVAVERGLLRASAGLRVDASTRTVVWQPRARVTALLDDHIGASISFARTGRLYQLITDPQPEPSLTFFDLWLVAGENGVPTPRVNHLSADVSGIWGGWSLHGAVYYSRGEGLGELRPIVDQTAGVDGIRFGDSRTAGLELRAAWGSQGRGRFSGSATYVLAKSDRRWEEEVWRPWLLDRRHTVRLQGQLRLGTRWSFFGTVEAASGQPFTAVDGVVLRQPPVIDGDSESANARIGFIYGPEGDGRGAGTIRTDLGIRAHLGGPGESRITLGLSVINLGFGPVAPEISEEPVDLLRLGRVREDGVGLKRRFSLPAVPSVTVRVEF